MTTTEPALILSPFTAAPGWFRELQASAWAEYQNEPQPARTNELWRFSSVKSLELNDCLPAPEFSSDPSQVTSQRSYREPAGRLVFANDALISAELFDSAVKKSGVIFTALSDALEKHSELIRQVFMAQPFKLG